MVSFLRDVMIVVAVMVTLAALAFYPGHDSASQPNAHDIPVGVPPAPSAGTAAGAAEAGVAGTINPQ